MTISRDDGPIPGYSEPDYDPLEDLRAAEETPEPDSWAPIDLEPYLRGEIERPEPTIGMRRSDGLQLLYPGREHSVIGPMEAGKTWFEVGCVAVELSRGKHVLFVHFEEPDPSDVVERLRTLGVSDAAMIHGLRFVSPERPVDLGTLELLLTPAPSLVVLDGVNEGMSLHNTEIRDEGGVAVFRRRLVKPCTKVGAAVLSADHVVKDPERRGLGPLGSVHKGNALSGSLIVLENVEPFGREQRGMSRVYLTKDRPGHLRRHGEPTDIPGRTYMGDFVIDDTQTKSPNLEMRFWAPHPKAAADPGEAVRTDEDAVLDAIRKAAEVGPAVLRTVRAASPLRGAVTDTTLERLRLAGRIKEESGPRKARIFSIIEDCVP